MAHWWYFLPAVTGPVGLAAWRYAPRAFLMVMGGLTKAPQRGRQYAEMLRLQRKDTKDLPSYLLDSSENGHPPSVEAQADQGSIPATSALEAPHNQHARAS